MSNWTSKENLLSGFERCEKEITDLGDDNKAMSAQLNIIDRLLNVIESHKPTEYGLTSRGDSDILYNIRQTKKALEDSMPSTSSDCCKATTASF